MWCSGIGGAGLVSASPSGPGQDVVWVVVAGPDEAGEQASEFGDGEWDQLAGRVWHPPFAALVRVTVRKAWASIASVMCRYQAS